MGTPRTVQRQLDAANELQAQLSSSQAPTGVVNDPSELAKVEAAPAPTPAPTPAPVPAPAPAPAVSPPMPDAWEQRYRTLQGMFQAEVAKFQTGMKDAQAQLASLTSQLKAAQSKPAEPAAATPEADPRDTAQFGQDTVDMVLRYTRGAVANLQAEMQKHAADLDERVQALERMVNGVTTDTSQTLDEIFFRELAAAVPDWQQVNVDERWLHWLGVADDLYGVTRQAALDTARKNRDSRRVAALFNKFKADVMAKQPTLDTQVAPPAGTASQPAPTSDPVKPLISSRAINAFYLDVAKGRYDARPTEKAAIEAQINLAVAEGRVV